MIYEDLGVKEYWVIDVRNAEILAFAIAETESGKGSYRIERSRVIADLEIALLEHALRMSRQQYQGQVTAWLLTEWQQKYRKIS